MALTFADHAIVVVNPEVSSVRDSDRIIGILQSRSRRAKEGREPVQERLLITRYSPRRVRAGEMLSYLDILEILKVPLLGVIPESQRVLEASNAGVPAVHETQTEVAQAYGDAIDRFLGKQVPLRFVAEEDKGFLRRLIDSMSRKAAA
jgi:septum site-determining protein MinD